MSTSNEAPKSVTKRQTKDRLHFKVMQAIIGLFVDLEPSAISEDEDYETMSYEHLIAMYKEKDPYGLGTPPEVKAETALNMIIIVGDRPDGTANSVHLNIKNITQQQIDEFNERKAAIPATAYIKKLNANITRLGFH